MNYNQRPVLLSSRETYEIYEKRSVSPVRPNGDYTTHVPMPPPRTIFKDSKFGQPFCDGPYPPPKSQSPSVHFDDSLNVEPQGRLVEPQIFGDRNNFGDKMISIFPSLREKKKLPMGWIICVAVSVPIFVVIVLFLAVWLQELGFL